MVRGYWPLEGQVLQGFLAQKKHPPPQIWDSAEDRRPVADGGASGADRRRHTHCTSRIFLFLIVRPMFFFCTAHGYLIVRPVFLFFFHAFLFFPLIVRPIFVFFPDQWQTVEQAGLIDGDTLIVSPMFFLFL